MPHCPAVRCIKRTGRKPYYQISIKNKPVHLGTDAKLAYKRAAELLKDQPTGSSPQSVAGMATAWLPAQLQPEGKPTDAASTSRRKRPSTRLPKPEKRANGTDG